MASLSDCVVAPAPCRPSAEPDGSDQQNATLLLESDDEELLSNAMRPRKLDLRAYRLICRTSAFRFCVCTRCKSRLRTDGRAKNTLRLKCTRCSKSCSASSFDEIFAGEWNSIINEEKDLKRYARPNIVVPKLKNTEKFQNQQKTKKKDECTLKMQEKVEKTMEEDDDSGVKERTLPGSLMDEASCVEARLSDQSPLLEASIGNRSISDSDFSSELPKNNSEMISMDNNQDLYCDFSIEDLELHAQKDPRLQYALSIISRKDSEINTLKREIEVQKGSIATIFRRLEALEGGKSAKAITYASIASSETMKPSPMKRSLDSIMDSPKGNEATFSSVLNPSPTMKEGLSSSTAQIQPVQKKEVAAPGQSSRKKRTYVYSEEAKARFMAGEPIKKNALSVVYIKGFESAPASFMKEMFSDFIPRRSIRNVCSIGHGITQLVLFEEEVENLEKKLRDLNNEPRRKASKKAVFVTDSELSAVAIDIVKGSQRNADRITNGLFSTKACLLNEARRFTKKESDNGKVSASPKSGSAKAPNH